MGRTFGDPTVHWTGISEVGTLMLEPSSEGLTSFFGPKTYLLSFAEPHLPASRI